MNLTVACRHDVIRIKLYHETDLQTEDYTGKVIILYSYSDIYVLCNRSITKYSSYFVGYES